MSTLDQKNDARLLNVGLAWLAATPAQREKIKVERNVLEDALRHLHELINVQFTTWFKEDCAKADAERKALERTAAYKREEKKRREENDRFSKQWAREKALQTARSDRLCAKARERYATIKNHASVGKVVVSLFDSITVDGTPVGNLYYSTLSHHLKKGAFEAHLCRSILNQRKPPNDMMVRDLIKVQELAGFVNEARKYAEAA